MMCSVSTNRLPSSSNMDPRGTNIHSINGPVCELKVEMEDHLFSKCSFALELCEKRFFDVGEFLPYLI